MRFFSFAYFCHYKSRFRLTQPDSGLVSSLGAHCIVMLALDAEFSKVVAAAIQKAVVTLFTVLWRGYKGEQD